MRATLFIAALGLLASALTTAASGQTITGRVVTPTGTGISGVNIDGFDSNGNPLDLTNDGTNGTGNFSTTVSNGPGVYTFIFYPPPPPASTHLVIERTNVVVSTTTNLGNLTSPDGVLLSGRAVRLTSTPVPNVTLSVIDETTGAAVLQSQLKTNSFGQFNLAVPAHSIALRLDATTSGLLLGSRELALSPTGATSTGDVHLPVGVTVTGHVQRTNGTPVAGCDLDFKKTLTGGDLYVPNDNSNVSGDFSVVVAKGNYTIRLTAKLSDLLATKELLNTNITATTNLGNITLNGAVKLFGNVLTALGAPAAHVDVDAFDHTTHAKVVLGRDNTDASGNYAVAIPTGTYDVKFLRDGAGAGIGADWHLGVVISAQTQLNGQLPLHGFGNSFSGSLPTRTLLRVGSTGKSAGAGGHAPGSGSNPPTIVLTSDSLALELGGLDAGAPALLLVADSAAALAADAPARVIPLRADGEGRARIELGSFAAAPVFLRLVALSSAHAPVASAIHELR